MACQVWHLYLREWSARDTAQFESLKALTDELQIIDDNTPTFNIFSGINEALEKAGIPFRYIEITQPGKYFIEVVQDKCYEQRRKDYDAWRAKFKEWYEGASPAKGPWTIVLN